MNSHSRYSISAYACVKRNETRIAVKRIPKHYLVGKRLIHLTVGRALLTLISISLVALLRFQVGLSTLVKEMLIAIGIPSSTLIKTECNCDPNKLPCINKILCSEILELQ